MPENFKETFHHFWSLLGSFQRNWKIYIVFCGLFRKPGLYNRNYSLKKILNPIVDHSQFLSVENNNKKNKIGLCDLEFNLVSHGDVAK